MDPMWTVYQDNAKAYDEARSRSLYEQAWLDAAAAGLKPGDRILDLGCGGGEPLARYFIEQGYALTGIDGAAALIALCRTRFPDHTWIVADLTDLSTWRDDLIRPGLFHLIMAWDSQFHLNPDGQQAALKTYGTLCAPGGALLFTSGPDEGDVGGAVCGAPVHHWSLSPEAYRTHLAAAGFTVLRYVAEDPTCTGHTVWLCQKTGHAASP